MPYVFFPPWPPARHVRPLRDSYIWNKADKNGPDPSEGSKIQILWLNIFNSILCFKMPGLGCWRIAADCFGISAASKTVTRYLAQGILGRGSRPLWINLPQLRSVLSGLVMQKQKQKEKATTVTPVTETSAKEAGNCLSISVYHLINFQNVSSLL